MSTHHIVSGGNRSTREQRIAELIEKHSELGKVKRIKASKSRRFDKRVQNNYDPVLIIDSAEHMSDLARFYISVLFEIERDVVVILVFTREYQHNEFITGLSKESVSKELFPDAEILIDRYITTYMDGRLNGDDNGTYTIECSSTEHLYM